VSIGIHPAFSSIIQDYQTGIEDLKRELTEKKGSYPIQYIDIEGLAQLLTVQKMLNLDIDMELGSIIQKISEEGDLTYLFFFDQFNSAKEFLTLPMIKKGLRI